MYGDSQKDSSEADKALPDTDLNLNSCLFDETVYLGEGAGPTEMRRAAEVELCGVIGRKLRRARKAAGMSESVAGLKLSHEGVTQISLFENGRRGPSLGNLKLLAELYGVTTDYLLDMHDNILAQPEEGNQAVLCAIVSGSLSQHFTEMVDNLAKRNAIVIEGLSMDRVLMLELVSRVTELRSALDVVKRHAPEFEDIRGGAKLARVVAELHDSMGAFATRKRLEGLALVDEEQEHIAVSAEVVAQRVQQLMIQL